MNSFTFDFCDDGGRDAGPGSKSRAKARTYTSAPRIVALRRREEGHDVSCPYGCLRLGSWSTEVVPNRGRPGKKRGTRELVVRSLPYIVIYQVSGDVVSAARILHGAQKRPE